MRSRTLIALALLGALALTSGCTWVRLQDRPETRTTTENKVVALDGATALHADLRIGVGELVVSSTDASGSAMVGDFTYAPASWKPEVSYAVEGTAGTLTVSQPGKVSAPVFDGVQNSWNVRLPKGVPTDLSLHLGVGTSSVDLRGTDLTALDVITGVGDTTVDLSGPRATGLTGRVEAGVGKLTLRLPKSVGVRVTGREEGVGHTSADGFIAQGGAWVNEAYSGSGPKIEIELTRGVGDVNLVLVD